MMHPRLRKIAYGGDYNPEQWPREVRDDDMRLFRLAGIDIATIGVFSWSLLQPSEDAYAFEWLDEIADALHANGVAMCLATATAAHPAWMAHRHPDVLRVDFQGRRRAYGQRHNSCPSSPTYRAYAPKLAGLLAERYGGHPGLAVWHVNNEYGGNCYCDACAAAFRTWLRDRYGDLDAVNEAWNTRFWSHTFYDWDEIVPPNLLSEHLDARRTCFQGISLDYARFNSDNLLGCFLLERDAIRAHSTDVPITTNMMGTYKPLDYFAWAPHLDVISWDSYPALDTPVSTTAFRHDLMRGLKDGRPFMLMEQTPSQQNWQPYNSLKRPGVMRLWSLQAVARGADTVMFFQLRRSRGACEKFHGAVIEHAGHEHTRVFRECAALGAELGELGATVLGARVEARVAIVFDWDTWWALEYSSGPSIDLGYLDEVLAWHRALFDRNVPVDVIGVGADLTRYDLVLAPLLYMVKPGFAATLEAFVAGGGRFVTTYFSGIVDERDLVTLGGYPGELRALLGIWVEETDALLPGAANRIVMRDGMTGFATEYACDLLCDVIHAESADVVAVYGDDFYAGTPVVTKHRNGEGEAWYVGSRADAAFRGDLVAALCLAAGIAPPLTVPSGVEVTRREHADRSVVFVLNHNDEPREVDLGSTPYHDALRDRPRTGTIVLPPKEVLILVESGAGSSARRA
jgi:beta-galactosidase